MWQWCILYLTAMDPDQGVKIGQNLVFLFLLPFVIYLSGFDLFHLSNFWWTVWTLSLGSPWNYIKWYNLSVIKRATIFKDYFCGCFYNGLWSRILENSPKLSKILATMKHYKKVFLTKHFLKKALCFYFDFLWNKF